MESQLNAQAEGECGKAAMSVLSQVIEEVRRHATAPRIMDGLKGAALVVPKMKSPDRLTCEKWVKMMANADEQYRLERHDYDIAFEDAIREKIRKYPGERRQFERLGDKLRAGSKSYWK